MIQAGFGHPALGKLGLPPALLTTENAAVQAAER